MAKMVSTYPALCAVLLVLGLRGSARSTFVACFDYPCSIETRKVCISAVPAFLASLTRYEVWGLRLLLLNQPMVGVVGCECRVQTGALSRPDAWDNSNFRKRLSEKADGQPFFLLPDFAG